MQVKQYKVKRFKVETKKLNIADKMLINTVNDFMSMDKQGQQRYALGAGLYKLRLASNDGKGNVTTGELKKLKILADILLGLSEADIDNLVKRGELLEVQDHV